jgi:hypothetical protein
LRLNASTTSKEAPVLRKVFPAVLAVRLVVAVGSAAPLKPDPAKPAADPELAGKLVIVTMKGEGHSTVLGNVRVKRLGGREFLLGEYVDEKGEHPVEATYWLPLDQVDFLMACQDVDAVKKVYGSRKKAEKQE